MKIRNMLLADGANVTADGKQNLLGAGVRTVYAPVLPLARQLTLFVSAEGDPSERDPVPVTIAVKSPRGTQRVMDTVAELQADRPIDERLPLVLNVRVELGDYIFQDFGIYDIVARIGKSRAVWRMVVDPAQRPVTPEKAPAG